MELEGFRVSRCPDITSGQYRDGDAVRAPSENTRREFSSRRKSERSLPARKGKIDLSGKLAGDIKDTLNIIVGRVGGFLLKFAVLRVK